MIDTKLILIEGIPCSGKSTTATQLEKRISARGIECRCFLEWSIDNPIAIGSVENLSEIIAGTADRSQNVIQNWKDFTARAGRQPAVNILESRFWQTDGMYLYLSGHPQAEVVESSRRLVSIISELNPVLIYLEPRDIGQLLTRVTAGKNREWRKAGKKGSWETWGNQVYEQQSWFTSQDLKGEAGVVKFFFDWSSIADKLFELVPFRKIRLVDPQADWKTSMRRIEDFLQLYQ
jgi:thymidylate kinase